MSSVNHVISVQSASKQFGKFAAVSNVSFDIASAEVVGFVGVNGAGKTTTINMLLGFTSPSKGSVELFGKRVKPGNAHVSHGAIGYAAGDMGLPETMTGQQYLKFVLAQSKHDHATRLKELTEIFAPQLHKKIRTLSRGNKQKIALVAAFVTEPKLVILDEPTSGLDPIMQDAFLDVVRSEQQKGTTIFMSSHYLQEVAEVCSRVILMKNGQVVEDLSAEALQKASGRAVSVVTKQSQKPPTSHAKNVSYDHAKKGFVLEFVYDGPIKSLLRWANEIDHLVDIEINERTLDAEFRSLYEVEEKVS